jgi:hypothetical protein
MQAKRRQNRHSKLPAEKITVRPVPRSLENIKFRNRVKRSKSMITILKTGTGTSASSAKSHSRSKQLLVATPLKFTLGSPRNTGIRWK